MINRLFQENLELRSRFIEPVDVPKQQTTAPIREEPTSSIAIQKPRDYDHVPKMMTTQDLLWSMGM